MEFNFNRPVALVVGIGVVVALLAGTNPSEEDHREAIGDIVKTVMLEETMREDPSGFAVLGNMIASRMVDEMIDQTITRDNYVLFSATRRLYFDVDTFEAGTETIGWGVFGKVYLLNGVEEFIRDSFSEVR